MQEAEEEKEAAGEGRNVEHVALQVDQPEILKQPRKKSKRKSQEAAV